MHTVMSHPSHMPYQRYTCN